MNAVFADTYFFLARLNPADAEHDNIVRLSRQLRRHMVTTEWVLTEVADALCQPRHRAAVSDFYRLLCDSPAVTIIPASHDLFREGMDLYARRRDKGWSLTDCISFVVMEDEEIADALTGDHHFTQAGFNALLAQTDK